MYNLENGSGTNLLNETIKKINHDLKMLEEQQNQICIEELKKDGTVIILFQDEKFEQFKDDWFKIKIKFKNDYPFSPPKVKFLSRMFHPNISENGIIEMAVLSELWNPQYKMEFVLDQIKSNLKNPNLNEEFCANQVAMDTFKQNQSEYYNIWFNMFQDGPELNDSDFQSKYLLVIEEQQTLLNNIKHLKQSQNQIFYEINQNGNQNQNIFNQQVNNYIQEQPIINQKEEQKFMASQNSIEKNNEQNLQLLDIYRPSFFMKNSLKLKAFHDQDLKIKKAIYFEIFQFLDQQELQNLQLVCKSYYNQIVPGYFQKNKIICRLSFANSSIQYLKSTNYQYPFMMRVQSRLKSFNEFFNSQELYDLLLNYSFSNFNKRIKAQQLHDQSSLIRKFVIDVVIFFTKNYHLFKFFTGEKYIQNIQKKLSNLPQWEPFYFLLDVMLEQEQKREKPKNKFSWAVQSLSKFEIDKFLSDKLLNEIVHTRSDTFEDIQKTLQNLSSIQKDQDQIALLFFHLIGSRYLEIEINNNASSHIDTSVILLKEGNPYIVQDVQKVEISQIKNLNQCFNMTLQNQSIAFSFQKIKKHSEHEFQIQDNNFGQNQMKNVTVIYIQYL